MEENIVSTTFTAKYVKEKIATHFNDDLSDAWDEIECLESFGDNKNRIISIENLGTIEYVDSYGGEGLGEEYWIVFRIGTQLFKIDGYYNSWNGVERDQDLYEVEPYKKTSTLYRRIEK